MRTLRIERRPLPDDVTQWPNHIHHILRRVYTNRGIPEAQHIEHRLASLVSPQALGGVSAACALLSDFLQNEQRIIVVGDFDADGATGTAVAVRGLKLLGARNIDYRVPNRFLHGYGLSATLVETLMYEKPGLIITVDNGIASHAGVALARAHGIKVLITDHHLPGDSLPNANAIVNPNLPGDEFPSKALAGVGVMFYLLLALRAYLRETSWFSERGIQEPDLAILLDLVALGTVADLVPLDFNNRILVDAGLRRIRLGKANPGIAALLAVSNREPRHIVASDLGFAIAPRINAAGRLEDMSLGIDCLLSDDYSHAYKLAEKLSAINAQRRELQSDMQVQSEAVVAQWMTIHSHERLPVGMVLFDESWHAGVVGLTASRLKEKFHRPVIACAPISADSDEIRASARSIAGFHIRDALAQIDVRYPGIIIRFGGHAMAAGLTLSRESLPLFTAAFDAIAREHITPNQLEPVLYTDGELTADDFCLSLAQQLRYAGPWGQAFSEPVFDNYFERQSWSVMGEDHLRLKLKPSNAEISLDAVYFGGYVGTPPPSQFRAAYQLDVDHWRGEQRLRLLIKHIELPS